MSEPKPKSFAISKRAVWEAWLRVKANRGAAGVDEQSIEEFESDLSGNLYKLWNRLSSGSYMPPPVRAVEIPKRDGSSRMLGVPTVADRVAQTVACSYLEPGVEPHFHPDSMGTGRAGRRWTRWGSAGNAAGGRTWVLDMDVPPAAVAGQVWRTVRQLPPGVQTTHASASGGRSATGACTCVQG